MTVRMSLSDSASEVAVLEVVRSSRGSDPPTTLHSSEPSSAIVFVRWLTPRIGTVCGTTQEDRSVKRVPKVVQ